MFVKHKEKPSGWLGNSVWGMQLDVIEKVDEGSIGRYRYAAFEITPDELKKYMSKACKTAALIIDDLLSEHGVPRDEREKDVQKVASCLRDPHEILDKYSIKSDFYVPDPEEIAAEYVMREALRTIEDAPLDAQASEEPGYGLPEYSLYWNSDARSFTGRWYWSRGGIGDICFGLITEDEICDKMSDMIKELETNARKKGRELLFGVWRTD